MGPIVPTAQMEPILGPIPPIHYRCWGVEKNGHNCSDPQKVRSISVRWGICCMLGRSEGQGASDPCTPQRPLTNFVLVSSAIFHPTEKA
jgi:hypothetical protein